VEGNGQTQGITPGRFRRGLSDFAETTKFTKMKFVANYLTLFLKSSDFSGYGVSIAPVARQRDRRPQSDGANGREHH
jgi:hypothetical protein